MGKGESSTFAPISDSADLHRTKSANEPDDMPLPALRGNKASLSIDIENDDSMEFSRCTTPAQNLRSPDKTVADTGSAGPSPRSITLPPNATTAFASIKFSNSSRKLSEDSRDKDEDKDEDKIDDKDKDADEDIEAERESTTSPPPTIHVAISPKMSRPAYKTRGDHDKPTRMDSQRSMGSHTHTVSDVLQAGWEGSKGSGESGKVTRRDSQEGGLSSSDHSGVELSPLTSANLARINEEAVISRAAGKPVDIGNRPRIDSVASTANDVPVTGSAFRARRSSIDSLDGFSSRITSDALSDELGMKLLDALGSVARERFTSQQLSMVADMYRVLRKGLTVRKHSKGHAPQRRNSSVTLG